MQVCNAENFDGVQTVVLSQKDRPGTHLFEDLEEMLFAKEMAS